MSRVFKKIIIGLVLGIAGLINGDLIAEDKLFFRLDGREWQIEAQDSSDQHSKVILIPEHTDAENSEMLMIQQFNDFTIDPKKFTERIVSTYHQLNPHYQMQLQWIDEDLNIVEMSMLASSKESNSLQNRYGVGRFIQGTHDFYSIYYSTNDKSLFEQRQQDWIQSLRDFRISDLPPEGDIATWYSIEPNALYKGAEKLIYFAKGQTVIDDKAKFSIKLPDGWESSAEWLESDELWPYTVVLQFKSPEGRVEGLAAFYDRIEPNQSMGAYVDAFIKQKGENLLTISGNKGKYAVLKQEQTMMLIVSFEKDKRIYRLEISMPESQYDWLIHESLGIARTFQVK